MLDVYRHTSDSGLSTVLIIELYRLQLSYVSPLVLTLKRVTLLIEGMSIIPAFGRLV
jgi:hypothetical protein